MKIYEVFSGVASNNIIAYDLPEGYYKSPPFAIDIFNFGNNPIKLRFIDREETQQDWLTIPPNFFYSIDMTKMKHEYILRIEVISDFESVPFQLVIWYKV